LIVVTEGKYFTRPYGWPFPKFSPFLDIFNFYISEKIEKGNWDAITNRYAPKPQICLDMSGKPIEFPNCFTAFLILICGVILAFLLFGLEFAMKPFDLIFDVIRKNLGDKSNKDQIRAMDRYQLEFTVNSQKDAMNQMKTKLAMYKKTSKSQYFHLRQFT
jgi:hypothetical protein